MRFLRCCERLAGWTKSLLAVMSMSMLTDREIGTVVTPSPIQATVLQMASGNGGGYQTVFCDVAWWCWRTGPEPAPAGG